MIKNLKRNDVQTTPFITTKPWVLTSFHNQDLVLTETTSSNIPVAEEFVDYEGGDELPILNRECNIALEQQVADTVIYEEGEKGTGTFYPELEPVNLNGSFKRLVYTQIHNAFYNHWQNPTKMFGLENIDFQLSKTDKFLTDRFRLFNVSRTFFGEKMLENTIRLVDNSLDDNFEIVDDGCGNILATENLFSRVQEIKQFTNSVDSDRSSSYCDSYFTNIEARQGGSTGSYGSSNTSSFLPPDNCQPW
jgi:hypothetical protein